SVSSVPLASASAASSNWSFHFVQVFFISLLPVKVFLQCVTASGRSLQAARAPLPPVWHPSLQPLRAVKLCGIFRAAFQSRPVVVPAEDAPPHFLLRPVLAGRCQRARSYRAAFVAACRAGGSTPA